MTNVDKNKDIIRIEPSDWEMILNGEKWVLFQNELSETFKIIIDHLHPNTKTIYAPIDIYLQDNQTGLFLGKTTISLIFYLLYEAEVPDTLDGLPKSRNDALKEIYFTWCAKKSIKPNPNEGWFKSKKFSAYLEKIGWGRNYALFIEDVVKYEPEKIANESV